MKNFSNFYTFWSETKIMKVKLDFEKSVIFNVETKNEEILGWFSTVCLINLDVFHVVNMETFFKLRIFFHFVGFQFAGICFALFFYDLNFIYIQLRLVQTSTHFQQVLQTNFSQNIMVTIFWSLP